METRPRIKLTLSQVDKRFELTGKILLFMMWGLTLFTFLRLPTTIPIHFNASGGVDSYGNKITQLILPTLATIIYFGLTQLNKYPHIFSYLTKITEANARKQYTIATRMLRFVKLAILFTFSLIILFTYLTAIGAVKGLGFWFLPLIEGQFLVPTAIAISQSLKKKNAA